MEIVKRKKKPVGAKDNGGGSAKPRTRRRTAACLELSTRHIDRRAFSEVTLLDMLGSFDFIDGMSYHFITAGDVDSLSYLKAMLRAQDCEQVLLSTWCMAAEDIYELQQWVASGKIKKLDIYVGEIFPNSYKVEYQMLCDMYANDGELAGGGRMAVFRNHSKIFAGIGDKFDFGIETSANVNTNPRTENGCITISNDIYQFYKEYFDGIKSFEYGKI